MKKIIKENWKIILLLAIVGLVGGIFTGLYNLETISTDMLNQVIEQIGNKETLIIVTAIQCMIYGIVCGFFGIMLSEKVGLWRKIKFEKKPIVSSIIVSIVSGLCLILLDVLIFNKFSQIIANSYLTKPTLNLFISSITYGGIIEEVMMRLFLMSLLSFIIYKLFYKNDNNIPEKVFIISNILTALLFACGHLPATAMLIGITPITLIRCILLNGGVGLLFGRLYRKYGIQYAMIAHIGCHILSKGIWILFI